MVGCVEMLTLCQRDFSKLVEEEELRWWRRKMIQAGEAGLLLEVFEWWAEEARQRDRSSCDKLSLS
jgi:hypothetical protein